eukprot:CAMPEP_0181218024 /NCGR_PEP_ID=MMETSP1096-20121128/27466_1 /TAXON_ID=156174 ORGANISM="Chrysochromulina ericina, Strain CCMP281" /NCGR_SAMPLE_ID=MMETSP1096 /ASSEMBLY_ACC=CAM_ASM_000453 /LENGTH=67 /DNA_ID=CAMNT_0023310199 /DNA_START=34 /DNA_END=237 /DNA_ORIENTATION=-
MTYSTGRYDARNTNSSGDMHMAHARKSDMGDGPQAARASSGGRWCCTALLQRASRGPTDQTAPTTRV